MTAEELRRLAEIAGFSISKYYSDFYTKNISKRKEIAIMVKDWRPHIRIEQAMMVAEQYIEWSVGKTSLKEKEKLYHAYVCTSQDDDMWFRSFGKTPSEAICRAALAAKEEREVDGGKENIL